MSPEVSAVLEREEGEDLMSLSGKVSAEVVGQIVELLGTEVVADLPVVDVVMMQDLMVDYLDECENADGETVARVELTINNYREKLGIALVSVRVTPMNEDREELRGEFDLKSPTFGFVTPGIDVFEVHFSTGSCGERVTSLSDGLSMKDVSLDSDDESGWVMNAGDSFGASSTVGLKAAVLDVEQLYEASSDDLPVRTARLGEEISAGIYFCRYMTR